MKPYYKITLIYLLFGSFWIFVSDRILDLFTDSAGHLTVLQTYKGWIFIFITAILLFLLIRKSYLELEERNREKREVFNTTMRAMHHILNNFLHKMMYFRIVAEENQDAKEDALKQYDQVIKETSAQITKLGEITHITPVEIEKAVYNNKFFEN
ncbi:MAG: hypothetical protein WC061_01225 [Melioribacteraceae bacterium]